MGRMLTFMARILTDVAASRTGANQLSRAVGIDEHTALLLDVVTGAVSTVGVGTAYVCVADQQPAVCAQKTPLTFHGMLTFVWLYFPNSHHFCSHQTSAACV
jgi:cyanophycinase-like exopeptidase